MQPRIDHGEHTSSGPASGPAAPYSEVPYPSAAVMEVEAPEVYARALVREWADGQGRLEHGVLSAGVGMFFRSGFAAYIESMRKDPEALADELRRANLRASLASRKLRLHRKNVRCSRTRGIAGNRKMVRPTMVPIAGNQKIVVTIHPVLPAIPWWS